MKVFLLRSELSPEEEAMIRKNFPGKEIEFRVVQSRDYLEHAKTCEELNHKEGDFVVLPKDRPIPSLAMEQGIPHVIITQNGLMELLPLEPKFKPFEPRDD